MYMDVWYSEILLTTLLDSEFIVRMKLICTKSFVIEKKISKPFGQLAHNIVLHFIPLIYMSTLMSVPPCLY